MALTIGQIAAVSYPEVLNEMRKATTQWVENSLMEEMESQGMVVRRSFGETLDETLDYRRNPAAVFLTTSLQTTSLAATEVLTAASYGIAELSAPVTWSKKSEVQNPTKNQKVSLVKSLLQNGIDSHDDLIEEAMLASSDTNGFHCALTLIPESGQGTVGGIAASTETFWRSQTDAYAADGSDIESIMTGVWNDSAKGSGSKLLPTLLFSGPDAHALFESTQVPFQRYAGQEIRAAAKKLWFKSAPYIFSQYGDDHIFMVNRKNLKLLVSKEYFRDKGETQEIDDANGFTFKIYSALQLVVTNKSRCGVVYEA